MLLPPGCFPLLVSYGSPRETHPETLSALLLRLVLLLALLLALPAAVLLAEDSSELVHARTTTVAEVDRLLRLGIGVELVLELVGEPRVRHDREVQVQAVWYSDRLLRTVPDRVQLVRREQRLEQIQRLRVRGVGARLGFRLEATLHAGDRLDDVLRRHVALQVGVDEAQQLRDLDGALLHLDMR